jgi:hypothetical protein
MYLGLFGTSCVLDWDPSADACALCKGTGALDMTSEGCTQTILYGYRYTADGCMEVHACACNACDGLPQTRTECEELGAETCNGGLC